MGRSHVNLSTDVILTTGTDHAVGQFLQLSDQRYSQSSEDIQGEGYVLDWDQLFGFNINLIGAKLEDLKDSAKLLELCNDFAKDLG